MLHTENEPQRSDYVVSVKLQELVWKMVCEGSYTIPLSTKFINEKTGKQHTFLNHMQWFIQKLKQNDLALNKRAFSKWQIYLVRYGMNIGSEMNGDRPSLVYKSSHNTFWEDIIVIPLTSVGEARLVDANDVLVEADKENNLYKNSYARLRQMRAVSIKRIGKWVGKVTNPDLKAAINLAIKKMLAVDNE